MTYPVHEQFSSFQGEGVFTGYPAYFIRLAGCPLQCSFCDVKSSWGNIGSSLYSAEELVSSVVTARQSRCVITGGEPIIHDLLPLANALEKRKVSIHLETSGYKNGACSPSKFSHITVSPKEAGLPTQDWLRSASCLKIVVASVEKMKHWQDYYWRVSPQLPSHAVVYWTPEWSQRKDKALLDSIASLISKGDTFTYPHKFVAGWQIHKCYGVD